MIRRSTVLVAVAAIAAALLGAGPAAGQAADAQGWWWQAQPAGSPAPVPAPPYVDSDGLYVANSEAGGEAMSALRFTIPLDSTVGSLSLPVGDVAGTPIVGMCAANDGWTANQNGAWEQRPGIDCAHAVAGKLSDDGKTMTFDAASLVRGGQLDVALVAGVDPSGASLPFHVAFHKPTAGALTVEAASGATATPAPASASDARDASAASAPSGAATGGSDLGSATPSSPAAAGPLLSGAGAGTTATATAPAFVPDPAVAAAPAAPGDPAATTAIPTARGAARRTVVPASSTQRPDDRVRFASLIGLIGVATIYLRLSQDDTRGAKEPRPLITFGSGVVAAADDGEEAHR